MKIKNPTIAWLWKVTGFQKVYVALLILLQAVYGGSGVLYALLLRNIVDSATAHDKSGFLRNVILRALPGGTAIAVGALLAMHLTAYGFSESMCSTVATWMAGLICALVLWRTCIPLNPRRGAVAAASTIAFVVTAALFGRVFLLDPLTLHAALAVAGLTALGAVLVFGTAAVIRRKGEQLH